MNKATELKTTTEIVKNILQRFEKARNSDDYLYLKVCESINEIGINLPFHKVILNREEYKYPAFESVRRTRQKLQATYPELQGTDEVEGFRKVNEEAFKNYARQISV